MSKRTINKPLKKKQEEMINCQMGQEIPDPHKLAIWK